MPKENIYSRTVPGRNIETGEVAGGQPRRISVGWAKGVDAQLGVGWAVDPKDSVLAGPKTTSASSPPLGDIEMGQEWHSEWIDLDRHMVNELIRALRKARDEAFGRDE